MREKPYNDTLKVNWVEIKKDTVSCIEYRANTVKIIKNNKVKIYHRRFFTICEQSTRGEL